MRASELITNPDGSIYHLGLRPEHLAELIVTVGDPDRVDLVSRRFNAIDFRQQRREFRTHVGRFAGRRIMCISTGIGTDNVDIVLNELDALANVDLDTGQAVASPKTLTFVRLGTSGTFQADVPVDTLMASSAAVGLDGLGPYYAFAKTPAAQAVRSAFPAFAAGAYGARADPRLLERWRGTAGQLEAGVTLTCAGFYGPQRRSIRLPFRGPSLAELAALRFRGEPDHAYTRLTNFEMETAGIYGLADLLGHRALSVSAILANRATGQFSTRPTEVVEAMIEGFFEFAMPR